MNRNNILIYPIYLSFLTVFSLYSCENKEELTLKTTNKGQISLNDAKLIAENALTSGLLSNIPDFQGRTKSNSPLEVAGHLSVADRNGIPALYLLDYAGVGNGFMIVSAERGQMPILGFSEYGDLPASGLTGMPPPLVSWLAMMEEEINAIRKGKPLLDLDPEAIASAWEATDNAVKVASGEAELPCPVSELQCGGDDGSGGGGNPSPPPTVTIGPWLSTYWEQGCGYNYYSPEYHDSNVFCQKAPTGCVAVAMAQIIRYHEHPQYYAWDEMPSSIGSADSPNTIARLMRDVGDAVGMDYSAKLSDVDTKNTVNALKNDFGYASASWADYTYSFSNTIESNLRSLRPVILRGKSEEDCNLGIFCDYENGHAWVCDGYKVVYTDCCSYKYYHMNWGWESGYNGWDAYNNWVGDGTNYQYERGVVYNIIP